MGKYTELDDAAIEKTVDSIIEEVSAQLVSSFRPRSIILAGSFARGEATIDNSEGRLSFLSDCEMVLVANRYLTSKRIMKKLSSMPAGESKPKFVIRSSIALPVYSLFPVASLLWKPNLWNYDLKYGSRTIYGQDYIARMPDFKPEQIPAWEGIRLVFNRMAEALRYFPAVGDLSAPEQEQETAFWVSKIILACQDALLITDGKYHVSSRMRNKLFQKVFRQRFSGLQEKLPQLTSLATRATDYKLRRKIFWTNITELWFDAAEICNAVLKHLLQKNMNIKSDSYLELPTKFINRSVFKSMMAFAGKFYKSPILTLPSVIRASGPWVPMVYPAIAQVYFSLSRNGGVDTKLLGEARKTTSLFTRIKPAHADPSEEWKYLKDEIYNIWYALGV